MNSTICTNSNSFAPYCRCLTELTFFFNNHSFLSRSNNGVICYYLEMTPGKEDINCFFSGSSCSGSWPVEHRSDNTNCVLTKFNFINNSDSSGYFFLIYNNKKRVKESVIAFKSTGSLRWLYPTDYTGATLSIERCFVIASGTIDGSGRVILTDGSTITASVQTQAPFHFHPKDKHCWDYSKRFSNSPLMMFNLSTLLICITASLASIVINS